MLSRFAVACPGQGIVAKGCLAHFRPLLPHFQLVLDTVDDTLGERFSAHLMADPPTIADAWSTATANAQPAIVTATYVTHYLLKHLHGIDLALHPRVSHLLGHSLGEYSALLLAGVLDLESAVRIVRRRGDLMQRLVAARSYAMHVLVFRPLALDFVVSTAAAHGVLACVNNLTQVLISGEQNALDAAVAEMNRDGKRVLKQVPLPVTVPFHNALLAPIEPELLRLPLHLAPPAKPIVANVLGRPATVGNEYLDTVRANSRPVQWKRAMEFVEHQGVTHVVNMGPGAAVDAINSRFGVVNHPLKTVEDMGHLARALA